MKKLIVLLSWLPLAAAAQKQLIINGKLTGADVPAGFVYLTDANTPTDTFAKGPIKNGSFSLKGSLREATLVNLNFMPSKKKALLFIDNGTITVSGSLAEIQKLKVEG